MADEFNFDGCEEMSVETKEKMKKNAEIEQSMNGMYTVVFEQCGPGADVEIFDKLEYAIEYAKSLWGDGCVGIRMPDGSYYKFPENWNMSAKINLIRVRKGQLNPRQQHLLNLWKEYYPRIMVDKWLSCPSQLWHEVKDCENEEAQKLFFESLDWGLFEVIDWINGWDMATDENVDKRLSIGAIRSV